MRNFVCDDCGRGFTTEAPIEVRKAEALANGFDDLPEDERAYVCDSCYDVLQLQHPDKPMPRAKKVEQF